MQVRLPKLLQLVCSYFHKILSLCFVCLFIFPLSDFPSGAFHFRTSVRFTVEVWMVSLPQEPTCVFSQLGWEAGAAGGNAQVLVVMFFSTVANMLRSDMFEVVHNIDI